MQNVLADLCVESEAATVAAMRLARFNIQSTGQVDKRYFVGMASPPAAGIQTYSSSPLAMLPKSSNCRMRL